MLHYHLVNNHEYVKMNESLLSAAVRHGAAGGGWREVVATGGPSPRTGVQVVTYGRNIYIHGGAITATGKETGELWRFNLDTATWTQMATSPGAVRLHRTIAVNKKIYTFGGYDGNGYVNVARSYDIAANTWAVITAPTTGVIGAANLLAVSVGSAIYLMGGVDGNFPNSSSGFLKLETYPSLVWSTLTAHPVPVGNGTMAVYDDKIYAGHGNSNNGTVVNDKIRSYDIYNNAAGWVDEVTIPTMNTTTRAFGTTVTKGEEIWYLGGSGQTDVIEAYNVKTKTYIPDTGFRMIPDKFQAIGWTAGNKQYLFDIDGKVWEFDNRRGQPKPFFVLVPHQEFFTSLEYAAVAFGANGAAAGVGCNWCLVRPANGKVYMYPQKFLRTGLTYGSAAHAAFTFAGQQWVPSRAESVVATTSIWDNVNSCLTLGSILSNSTLFPRAMTYRNNTMGFVPSQYVWTSTSSGAYDYVTRGGSSYGGVIAQHNMSTIGFKAIFELTNGATLPW